MLLTGYRQTLSTRPMTGIHQLPVRDFLAMLFVLTRASAMIGRLNLPDKDNRRLRQKADRALSVSASGYKFSQPAAKKRYGGSEA